MEEKNRSLTVAELKRALESAPDDVRVTLSSDSGVDQGMGIIIVELARYLEHDQMFEVYANDRNEEELTAEECEFWFGEGR